ncbi:ABC transporter permease [Gemmatimonadota bacterium]
MYYLKLIAQFYQDIRRQKLRTFLTVFGICWGTIAVVLLLAFGVGLQRHAAKAQKGMGENICIAWPGKTTLPYRGMGIGRQIKVYEDDMEYLRQRIPEMGLISAEYHTWGNRLSYKDKSRSVSVSGAQPVFSELRNIIPAPGGRFINRLDQKNSRRVIFLGNEIRDKLFGEGSDPVGKTVQLDGTPFKVIGILQDKMQNNSYTGSDKWLCLIPSSTFRTMFGRNHITNMVYRAKDPALTGAVIEAVARELGRKYKFDPKDKGVLDPWDVSEGARFLKYFFMSFNAFLGVAGFFTLLVGGIGVANIMYVVVRERRREVGIKMALGAKPTTILLQFMVETLMIVSLGAGVGFAVSASIVQLFNLPMLESCTKYIGTPTINPLVALGTACVLAAVSFAAGYAPARRAARMDPVKALEA